MLNYRSLGEATDAAFKATAMLIKKNPPSKVWLLQVLATIDPDHLLFTKEYRKPTKQQQVQVQETMVNNSDGFFSGLPILGKRKKGRAGVSFVD